MKEPLIRELRVINDAVEDDPLLDASADGRSDASVKVPTQLSTNHCHGRRGCGLLPLLSSLSRSPLVVAAISSSSRHQEDEFYSFFLNTE